MSRTYRDILRVKERQWWQEARKFLKDQGLWYWRHLPRDLLRENPDQRGYPKMGQSWRKAATRRDRHIAKDSLRHGGMLWYYRHKKRDDDGW